MSRAESCARNFLNAPNGTIGICVWKTFFFFIINIRKVLFLRCFFLDNDLDHFFEMIRDGWRLVYCVRVFAYFKSRFMVAFDKRGICFQFPSFMVNVMGMAGTGSQGLRSKWARP